MFWCLGVLRLGENGVFDLVCDSVRCIDIGGMFCSWY